MPMLFDGRKQEAKYGSNPRLTINLEATLWPDCDPEPVECTTVSFSDNGFYCLTNKYLPVGTRTHCEILIPTRRPEGDILALKCAIQILQVEEFVDERQYGLVCRIENFLLGRIDRDGSTE